MESCEVLAARKQTQLVCGPLVWLVSRTDSEMYGAATPCPSTQVAFSDYDAPDSITGITGDTVYVTCIEGWTGSGYAECSLGEG